MTTKVNSEASYKEAILQTMSEITDLLQKSGAMPLAKDDEEGGVDDAPAAEAAPVDMPPPAEGDASGEASLGADDAAADEAISDLGEVDGQGDDGMDGRAEVEQMVADMSDDELELMLECLTAEHAARGAGEPEQDAGDAEIEPDMDTAEDTLDAPEGDVGQDGDMVEPEMEEPAPESDESSEEEPEEFGKSDDMEDDLSKARVDEGKSDQRKATARAARNDRQLSSPKGTLKRDHQFHEKKGAMPGRKGESVVGKPKTAEKGVHAGGEKDKWSHNLPGGPEKSASVSHAGSKARWDKANAGKGRSSLNIGDSAKELHQKKLGELKDMNKSEEKDDDKDEMKKSIQLLTEYVTALEAQVNAPKAAPVVVTKPLASSRPVGQALEKSMSAPKVAKLSKSQAIEGLMDTLRKEQYLSPAHKTVNSGMIGDLDRAQPEKADQMIAAFQDAGLLPK